MEGPSGVRKGAWNRFEDDLLKACVQQYGEGKWHLVPRRAGLNRCHKSCRLRWLNYLRPNIKRGDFGEDEVDLMIRLHKLLGNRWSLIAGRLPGRTSNDVKNYWNTYVRRKIIQPHKKGNNTKKQGAETVKPPQVIKPLPHTFSKTSPWLQGKFIATNHVSTKVGIAQACGDSSGSRNWWETLLDDKADNGKNNGVIMMDLWGEDLNSMATKDGDFLTGQTLSEYLLDVNLWDTEILSLRD